MLMRIANTTTWSDFQSLFKCNQAAYLQNFEFVVLELVLSEFIYSNSRMHNLFTYTIHILKEIQLLYAVTKVTFSHWHTH